MKELKVEKRRLLAYLTALSLTIGGIGSLIKNQLDDKETEELNPTMSFEVIEPGSINVDKEIDSSYTFTKNDKFIIYSGMVLMESDNNDDVMTQSVKLEYDLDQISVEEYEYLKEDFSVEKSLDILTNPSVSFEEYTGILGFGPSHEIQAVVGGEIVYDKNLLSEEKLIFNDIINYYIKEYDGVLPSKSFFSTRENEVEEEKTLIKK